MRIAIVAPAAVPPTRGGAERAWEGLRGALVEAGHDAEITTLPVAERSLGEVVAGYRAFAELDVAAYDLVVTSKYPAWLVGHPRHVLWMFHPLRGLYDTYHLFGLPIAPGPVERPTADLLAALDAPHLRTEVPGVLDAARGAVDALGDDHPDLALPGPVARVLVHWLDRVALDPREVVRHTALSRTIAARPGYLPDGVVPRVAYAPSDLPPVPDDEVVAGDHLFTASRLDGPKRLDLVVQAMAHVPGDVPLLIGGTGPEEDRLRSLAAGDARIRFLGFVPDDELLDLYRRSRAVPFVPLDEDYGLITVEAMATGTPIVTTSDSGGPAELVRDDVDGLVVAPDPRSLGRALAALVTDPDRATAMGAAARLRAAHIHWPAAVRTILGPTGRTAPRAHRRPAQPATTTVTSTARRLRVVSLTTFRVADRGHGGQLRSFNLYGALGRHADVEIVSLTDGGRPGRTVLAPGLAEVAVPRSEAHRRAADEMSLAVGLPVSDLAAGSEIRLTPDYLDRLRAAATEADVVLLAEPYLAPALDAAGVDLPVVYDAFNVEADLKADVLPRTPAGEEVLRRVVEVEERALARAAAVTACSAADGLRLATLAGRPRSDVTVVPNGTDTTAIRAVDPDVRAAAGARWLRRYHDALPRRDDGDPATAIALFLGSWHPPNLAAAEMVVALAHESPEVVFVMGGRHGDAFDGRTLPANVLFTGVLTSRSKDVLLRAAHVAINPMVQGSGTNLKIIEYMAAGVPVVSTAIGARGLDLVHGEHLLVADESTWSAALRDVAADPASAATRATAARALVERHYDWRSLGDRLAAVVTRVAAR